MAFKRPCWSIFDFPGALLYYYTVSTYPWPVKVFEFCLMKGHSPLDCTLLKLPDLLPHVQKCDTRLSRIHVFSQHGGFSNVFKMYVLTPWRFSGYYWLNQTKQVAHIPDTEKDTFMDEDLVVIVVFKVGLMWSPSRTPLKICREESVCTIQDITNRRR